MQRITPAEEKLAVENFINEFGDEVAYDVIYNALIILQGLFLSNSRMVINSMYANGRSTAEIIKLCEAIEQFKK